MAVGCDVVEVDRVGSLLARRPEARDRLFTPSEQADAVRDGVGADDPAAVRRLAARFAAKEALVKLLGRPSLAWTDVEVRTGEDGAPSIHIDGHATDIAVSLSHDRGVAMAVVARATTTTATAITTATATTSTPPADTPPADTPPADTPAADTPATATTTSAATFSGADTPAATTPAATATIH